MMLPGAVMAAHSAGKADSSVGVEVEVSEGSTCVLLEASLAFTASSGSVAAACRTRRRAGRVPGGTRTWSSMGHTAYTAKRADEGGPVAVVVVVADAPEAAEAATVVVVVVAVEE